MIINISEVLKTGKSEDLKLKEEINFKNFKLKGPVSLEVEVKKISDIIEINGKVDFIIITRCSRCNKKIEKSLTFDFLENFSMNEKSEEEEINKIKGFDIDLSPFIKKTVIRKMPIKILCDESCKGICHKCGTDLNEEKCECTNEYINPAFAGLKDLDFKN